MEESGVERVERIGMEEVVNEPIPIDYDCPVCKGLRKCGETFRLTLPILRDGTRCSGCPGQPYEHHHHIVVIQARPTRFSPDEEEEFKEWKRKKREGLLQ